MRAFFLILGAVGLLGYGCDDGDSDDSGGGSGAATNCQSRCEAKLGECNQPTAACPQLCDGNITEGELSCYEGKSCEQLATGDTADCEAQGNNNNGNGNGNANLSCDCNNDGETDISGVVTCNGQQAANCEQACGCLGGGGGVPDIPGLPGG